MDTNKKWVATLCMVIVGITSICFLLGETPACTVYTGGLVAVEMLNFSVHRVQEPSSRSSRKDKASQDSSCGRCLFKLTCGLSTYAQFLSTTC